MYGLLTNQRIKEKAPKRNITKKTKSSGRPPGRPRKPTKTATRVKSCVRSSPPPLARIGVNKLSGTLQKMELLSLDDDIPALGGPNPRNYPPKKIGSPELLRRLHGIVYDDDDDNIFNTTYISKPLQETASSSSSSSKRPMTLPSAIPKIRNNYRPQQKVVIVKNDRFVSDLEPMKTVVRNVNSRPPITKPMTQTKPRVTPQTLGTPPPGYQFALSLPLDTNAKKRPSRARKALPPSSTQTSRKRPQREYVILD